MSIVDKVTGFNDFVQKSLDNTMGAVQKIHQTAVEIPIDAAKKLGLSNDKAELLKVTHSRILTNVYGALCNVHGEIGGLVVQQAGELGKLARDLSAKGAEPTARKTRPRKKTAKKTAKKGALPASPDV